MALRARWSSRTLAMRNDSRWAGTAGVGCAGAGPATGGSSGQVPWASNAGGDSGAALAGHGDPPVSSPRRAWHHWASLSNAAALILGGPPPVIQAVA